MQYVVKSGDTLSAISQRFYGSPYYYQAIVEANPIIQNADRIEIGWILNIPGEERMGPIAPGAPTMNPPQGSFSPSPAPTPTPMPTPGPSQSPAMSQKSKQTMYIILAVASLALGYLVMQHFAKQEQKPAAQNPKRSRKVEDDQVVEEDEEDDEEEEIE